MFGLMKQQQLNSSELGILSEQSTYESLGSPHREMEKIQQLLAENQRLKEQNSKLEQMNESIRVEKEVTEEVHKKEMEKKDVEITMQKVTITHLQDAYIALKTGQPYVPSTRNHTNNTPSPCGKIYQI